MKVSGFKFAHDIGRPINPNNVIGQLEGCIHMGMGYALFEEMHVEKGRILNPSFLNYKVPTALEMPKNEILLVESEDLDAPFGAKECAEGSIAPIAAAIANAIYDAIGIRIMSLPITPEKILKALREVRG